MNRHVMEQIVDAFRERDEVIASNNEAIMKIFNEIRDRFKQQDAEILELKKAYAELVLLGHGDKK